MNGFTNLLVLQVIPLYPVLHAHVKLLTEFVHRPWLQGLEWQSEIIIFKNYTEKS